MRKKEEVISFTIHINNEGVELKFQFFLAPFVL